MNKLLIAALFTAGLATAMPAAVAQTAAPQTKGAQARPAGPDHHANRPGRLPGERVEAKLAYLQTALKITDAQKSSWESFAATMRKQARDMDKRIQDRRAQMADRSKQQPSGIDRLERRQKMMAARAQQLNELLIAAKPLYATFSAEQKQIADGLLAPRHGRDGHKRGHGGMRGNA